MKKRNRALASATVLSLVLTSTVTATNVQAAAEVTRVPGANRETTSMEVAKQVFGTAETVVLVNGYGYADAVSATPLAKALNAPILLTNKVDAPTAELTATLAKLGAKKVVIVGGEGAVTAKMAEALDSNYTVERIGGASRYETNALVAKKVLAATGAKAGVLVSAEGYADALSVASIAAAKGMPVLFGNKNEVPAPVKEVAAGLDVVAVGGTGVLPASVLSAVNATRVAQGATRFETNLAVLDHFKGDLKLENIYVAAGGATQTQFADALVASAAAAKASAPVVLTGAGANAAAVDAANDYITGKMTADTKVTVIGGTASVEAAIVKELQAKADEINGVTGEIVVQSVQGTTSEVDLAKDEDDLTLEFTINGSRKVTVDDLENAGYEVEFVTSEDVLKDAATGDLDKADLTTLGVDETFDYQVVVKDNDGDEVARSEAKEVTVVDNFQSAKQIDDITIVANDVEIGSNKLVVDETAQITEVEYTNSKGVDKTLVNAVDGDNTDLFADYDVEFTSSNPSVAFVSKTGEITAIKEGTTTITIEVRGLKKSVTITVVDEDREPKKATVEATSVKIGNGTTRDLKMTVLDQFGDPVKGVTFDGVDLLKDVKNADDDVIATTTAVATDEDGETTLLIAADADETGSGKLYVKGSFTNADGDAEKSVLLATVSVEVTGLVKVDSRKLEKVTTSDDFELDLSDSDDREDGLELAYNTYTSQGAYIGKEKNIGDADTNEDNKPDGGEKYLVESSDEDVVTVDFDAVTGVITVKPATEAGTAYVKILENGILKASQKITVVNDNERITAARFETAKITDVQTIDLDSEVLKPENITVQNKKGVTRIDDAGMIYLDLDNNSENDADDIELGQLDVATSSVYDDDDNQVSIDIQDGKIVVTGAASTKFQPGTTGTIVVKIFDTAADTDRDGKTTTDVLASGTITIDIAK